MLPATTSKTRLRVLSVAIAVAAATAFAACGDEGSGDSEEPVGGGGSSYEQATAPDGPVHVHGLGLDPGDGALYIATHTGLFRAPKGEGKATRVGESKQDVMGFSIPAKGRFLGSGHPDPSDTDRPPNLGLIESSDGGKTWSQVSLEGQADFHVLRSSGERVYGFNGLDSTLMVSSDGGREWKPYTPPGPLIDLAIDPRDDDHLVAASEQGISTSTNGGRSWRSVEGAPGLLAWPSAGTLYRIDGQGSVSRSDDGGRRWREGLGNIGGQPAAFMGAGKELYAALPDGTVKLSRDGGRSWSVRSTP